MGPFDGFFRQVLPESDAAGEPIELLGDLTWHNQSAECRYDNHWLKQHPEYIPDTTVYQHIENFTLQNDAISDLISFAYMQLINDVLANRAQNEHIAPAINKLKSKQTDIRKIFDPGDAGDLLIAMWS